MDDFKYTLLKSRYFLEERGIMIQERTTGEKRGETALLFIFLDETRKSSWEVGEKQKLVYTT